MTGPAPAANFGRIDDDGVVYLTLPGGDERRVGQWSAGDPAQAMDFFTRRYADLITEIDLAAKRLADDRCSPEQALETAHKVRQALAEPAFVGDLAALVARIGQLEVLVNVKRAAAAEARAQARTQAILAREVLATEAESLAESPAWKVTTERFKVIIDEWKELPHADRATEQELWKRLSAARATFDKRRKQHFAELEVERDAAREAKQKLVKKAQELSESRDWGPTTRSYRELLEQWKKAGRAGKADDALWQEFKSAQDVFFTARNAVFEQRGEQEKAGLEAKEKLAAEAEALLPVKDLKQAKRSMRVLQEKWEKAGRVPRGDIARLDKRMKAVEDAIRSIEQDKWRRENPEVRARASSLAEAYQASVDKLEQQRAAAESTGDETAVAKLDGQLTNARAMLAAAQGYVS